MKWPSHDDKLIERYLLGELPEADLIDFEEHAFADKDYLQNVLAVEKDLMDEYVRGELSDSQRREFEQRFLASEIRLQKIDFARAFTKVSSEFSLPAAESSRRVSPRSISGRNFLFPFWRGPNLAVRFSLAALVVLFLIAGVWLIRKQTRSGLDYAQNPSIPQSSSPVPMNLAAKPTPGQLAQNELKPTPSPGRGQPAGQSPKPIIATLLLLPGTSRSTERLHQLVIPQEATFAQLHITIESGETYKYFRAELRTTSGKLVHSQSKLQAHTARSGRIVAWNIPANLLNSDEYELALRGANEQGQFEAISYYYFKVVKQ